MNSVARLFRTLAITASLALGAATLAPALAATSDIDLLRQYLGEWKGRGTVTGARTETIVCRMSLTDANGDKLNYAGRCTLAGTTLSMNGTVAWIAEKHRFEAAMTTNASFSGTAVGQKRGDTIAFDLKDREKDEQGNDMDITANMLLSGGAINVKFQVVFPATGDRLSAEVPFRK
jgi:hypothetical protein